MARLDARLFLDEAGQHRLLDRLSRPERRKIEAESRKIAEKYSLLMQSIYGSGARYPIDQLLRQFANEYNNRYASSGLHTQPSSFNYIESFLKISLFEKTYAPNVRLHSEVNHLFSVPDFMDVITSDISIDFKLTDLYQLNDSEIYNFTQNGKIDEFSYLTADGREFYVSGFSMIRHGDSIHWVLLGGDLLSQAEWDALKSQEPVINLESVHPSKRRFMQDVAERIKSVGAPLALEGTVSALRTIIAGETDLLSSKHISRAHMIEHENAFTVATDDPEIVDVYNERMAQELLSQMVDKLNHVSVLWSLAEGFLNLPSYFKLRLALVPYKNGKIRPKVPKTAKGVSSRYNYVHSLQLSDEPQPIMQTYIAPMLPLETEGYWKHLPFGEMGVDRSGKPKRGKTWIKKHSARIRTEEHHTVYVKSTIRSARLTIDEYVDSLTKISREIDDQGHRGVLYVLRCTLMREEVYKVGWTSGTASERAKQLSSATGVPSAFAVVGVWPHPDPSGLEAGVHAQLAPYRVSASREFFELDFPSIRSAIEGEIRRIAG